MYRYLTPAILVISLFSCGTSVERTTDGTRTGSGSSTSQVGALTFDPAGGTFSSPVTVTVKTATANAIIYCTRNGIEPNENSPLYTGSISIPSSLTLRCRAFRSDLVPSNIAQAVYTISGTGGATPTPTPIGGGTKTVVIDVNYGVDQTVELWVENGNLNQRIVDGSPISQNATHSWIITYLNGTPINTVQPWNGAPASLALPDFGASSAGTISFPANYLMSGRNSVTLNGSNHIIINDSDPNWSPYWFVFNYTYTVTP
ncbi:MAG: chitobiase/beta-hexosaminidase C-terminal domain-containing protein [Pseudomonadota bacterium]